MKMTYSACAAWACLSMFASPAVADNLLELGVLAEPGIASDSGYEAFSSDGLGTAAWGASARFNAATLPLALQLLPLLHYRWLGDEGQPYEAIDTDLRWHELTAGVRLRRWLAPGLGVFVQAEGGVLFASAEGVVRGVPEGARGRYEASGATFSLGGLLGAEVRIPPAFLRSVDAFNIGLELGVGYTVRGGVGLDPTLGGGDEHSLPVQSTPGWGELNMSGWMFAIGLNVGLFPPLNEDAPRQLSCAQAARMQ